MFHRTIQKPLSDKLFSGKTIILLGARQVGKTTLLKKIIGEHSGRQIWINGDVPRDRSLLADVTPEYAKSLFPTGSIVVIDEAQRIENTGLTLKIIHDACPDIQLIATGSSSFELTDKLKEPMTGRKWTMNLFPISLQEVEKEEGRFNLLANLEQYMIYGMYPDVLNRKGEEEQVLQELSDDYLFKDIFRLHEIRKPDSLVSLVQALAYQIGNEVSYRELAQLTGLDKETVLRYIQLLEAAFVIFRLGAFSRNLRNELKKSRKIYFWDTGIRNSIIRDHSPLSARKDVGQIWENFLISERLKANQYSRNTGREFFWRTTDHQEIDYLEAHRQNISAYEIKWNPGKSVKVPSAFSRAYPDADFKRISRDNFLEEFLFT